MIQHQLNHRLQWYHTLIQSICCSIQSYKESNIRVHGCIFIMQFIYQRDTRLWQCNYQGGYIDFGLFWFDCYHPFVYVSVIQPVLCKMYNVNCIYVSMHVEFVELLVTSYVTPFPEVSSFLFPNPGVNKQNICIAQCY